jgi:hypothetical protein
MQASFSMEPNNKTDTWFVLTKNGWIVGAETRTELSLEETETDKALSGWETVKRNRDEHSYINYLFIDAVV